MEKLLAGLFFCAGFIVPLNAAAQESTAAPEKDTGLEASEAYRKGIYREKMKEINTKSKSQLLLSPTELEEKALLRKRRIETFEGKTTLEVFVLPVPRCGFGDLDVIAKDMKYSANKHDLLVAVEPLLDEQPVPVYSARLPFGSLEGGASLLLTMPVATPPLQLGLFICKDSSGTGRCSDKPPMNFQAAMEGYMEADKQRSARKQSAENLKESYTKLASDKVYYFAYLSVDTNYIASVYSKASDKSIEHLTHYLQTEGIVPSDARMATEKMKEWNEAVFSTPLDFASSRVSIKLPRFDPSQCQKPAGK